MSSIARAQRESKFGVVRYNRRFVPESGEVLLPGLRLPRVFSGRGSMRIRDGVEVAGLTDVGCQRQNNEDHYSYWEPASEKDFENKGRLAIVADGMGGHEGGQEASHMAVEVI